MGANSVCVLVDIGVCTAMVVTNGGENPRLVNIQNVWQILTMVSSFLTNLSSTFIIGMKAWYVAATLLVPLAKQNTYSGTGRRLRRAIADAFQEHAQERHVTSAGPVLLLLIESGALYCIASVRNTLPAMFTFSTDYRAFCARLYSSYS